jgi:hypothetical protein
MSVETISIWIENMVDGMENGAWMHEDKRIRDHIIPRAYTSDLGVLRLRVKDLHHAAEFLKEKGFMVRQKSGAIEVVPAGSEAFHDVVKLLKEHGTDVELTAIIPGIYQG